MPSSDPVSSITNCHRLIVSYILTQYTASSSRDAQLSQLDLVHPSFLLFSWIGCHSCPFTFYHCCCTGLLSHLLSLFISPLLNSSFLMNGLTLSSLHFLPLLHYNAFATPSYLLRLSTSPASLTEVQNRKGAEGGLIEYNKSGEWAGGLGEKVRLSNIGKVEVVQGGVSISPLLISPLSRVGCPFTSFLCIIDIARMLVPQKYLTN